MRAQLVLKMKPLIAEKAKENQRGGQGGILLSENSPKAIDTRVELASAAHVSDNTISRVETIEREAPESIKQKARSWHLAPQSLSARGL